MIAVAVVAARDSTKRRAEPVDRYLVKSDDLGVPTDIPLRWGD
jgi:hypothetical protein